MMTTGTRPVGAGADQVGSGTVSLEFMLTEIGKLDTVRAVGMPDGVFSGIAPKVVAAWRARATVEAPSHLRSQRIPGCPGGCGGDSLD
jgi:hypothetical protein